MLDPYWLSDESRGSVNPNPPIGMAQVWKACEGSVLDYGCGYGRHAEASEPDEYLGVDVNSERIATARAGFPAHDFAVIGCAWDIYNLVPAQWDTALADNVLLHVPDEEIGGVMAVFATCCKRVVIAEHLGKDHRGNRHQWHREWTTYDRMLSAFGLRTVSNVEVENPRHEHCRLHVMCWAYPSIDKLVSELPRTVAEARKRKQRKARA